jgi:hypothetical protein
VFSAGVQQAVRNDAAPVCGVVFTPLAPSAGHPRQLVTRKACFGSFEQQMHRVANLVRDWQVSQADKSPILVLAWGATGDDADLNLRMMLMLLRRPCGPISTQGQAHLAVRCVFEHAPFLTWINESFVPLGYQLDHVDVDEVFISRVRDIPPNGTAVFFPEQYQDAPVPFTAVIWFYLKLDETRPAHN